jgi:small subunit ribosomal protein S18
MARPPKPRGKSAAAAKRAPRRKKPSPLAPNQSWVDYKDVNLLRRFLSERAKIRARRVTGLSQQQQQEVSRAIKLAREMALLPYVHRAVTVRKGGGKRGDGERRGRRDEGRSDESAESAVAVIDADADGEGVLADDAVTEEV